MKKKITLFVSIMILLYLLVGCSEFETGNLKVINVGVKSVSLPLDAAVIDLSTPASTRGAQEEDMLCLVKLKGKVNHFGYNVTTVPPAPIPYEQNVSGVTVWIAEYPFTKLFNIKTNEAGYWTMWIIKKKDVDLDFSFIYEKEGWITTKSNIISINNEDNTDLVIQFIDPLYYQYAVKPGIESQLSSYLGYSFILENCMVATVGKSWASIYDPRLPHGDAGATAILTPSVPAIGPIYFNENMQPDPTYRFTSIDGGVVWLNIPVGIYEVTAEKEPYLYRTIRFNINSDDKVNNVVLYIASPPDSIQGTNSSGPGEL